MRITIITGKENRFLLREYNDDILLSTVFVKEKIDFHMPCGGNKKCGKCKVIAKGNLSKMSEKENLLLTDVEKKLGIRFACCTYATGDCSVEIMDNSYIENIVSEGFMPIFKKNPLGNKYGIAIDIGTTTVVVYLYRLSDCFLVGKLAEKNTQWIFGADVVSRIEKSLLGEKDRLAEIIRNCLNQMIQQLCKKLEIEIYEIDCGVITGNTAMLYMLTGRDVSSIATAPFEQDTYFDCFVSCRDLGLSLKDDTSVYLTKCISAYVGGDITCAILASELVESLTPSALIDIGTNGEMALFSDGNLICCSTAAGPAFEGAGIHMGMNGNKGAIDKVWIEGKEIKYSVIGNTKPIGICGSGIIDLVFVLLKLGIIDETGLMLEEEHEYLDLLVEIHGHLAFKIGNSEVVITQKDIREIQLAKAAICGGIKTLIYRAKLEENDIKTLYIAGGFGSYINTKNAECIGLIPKGYSKKAVVIGNAAGIGASMVLQSKEMLAKSQLIAQMAENIELSTDPYFSDKYVLSMMFE